MEERSMGEWQPIETAPTDGTMLILAIHDGGDSSKPFHIAIAGWSSEDAEWKRDFDDPYSSTWPPSYWLPLPAVPDR